MTAGQDQWADPDWQADLVPASAPASCPGASVARHHPGSAAAPDLGAEAVASPAAWVVEEEAAAVAADSGAQPAAGVAAVAVVAGVAAAAGASSNRGAHTKDEPHSSAPNSRRD